MATNVEVINNGKENSLAIIRRFTKKVQKSGVLPKKRSLRYSSRSVSEYVKKKRTLKYLKQKVHIAEEIKLGRMAEKVPGTRSK
jgi:ribosomal protein S21